jgi:hypothetical protein
LRQEYLRAFQTQDAWLRWDTTAQADDLWANMASMPYVFTVDAAGRRSQGAQYIKETRIIYTRPLLHGECYWVSERIVRNLVGMTPTMPLFPLREDMLFSRYGFALLGAPVWIARSAWPSNIRLAKIGGGARSPGLPAEADTEIVIDAIGWCPSVSGVQFAGYQKLSMIDLHNAAMEEKVRELFPAEADFDRVIETARDKPIHISLTSDDLLRMRGRVTERPGFYPITHFDVRFGQTWADVSADFERLKTEAAPQVAVRGPAPFSPTGVAAEEHIDEETKFEEHIDEETKFTFALFNFMNDTRVMLRRQTLPRGFRRHQKRPVPIKDVNVILLRADEERERSGDPSEPQDWDWQWDVREHMRFNRKTGKKDIHVSAYRKGPPDKPLKPRGRDIYVVAR